MKTFKFRVGGQTLSISLHEKQDSIAEVLVDGEPHVPAADEMPAYAAAIALALIEHEVEIVHDDEPGFITVTSHHTHWNDPATMMTQL